MFNTALYAQAIEKIPQKYLLTNLISIRARQIINGADPLVEAEGLSPIDTALKEVAEEMIKPRKGEVTTGEDLFG